MKFVADLHLHSKYSRAVSQQMTLANMAMWAKYKGINVLATSDFTHPFWFEKLKGELEESGNGLYQLKSTVQSLPASRDEQFTENDHQPLTVHHEPVNFILSCEISSIYSQGGKGRRVHNLVFFPSLASVEKFNNQLKNRGANLRSDGRPIVGISSRDLLELALTVDEKTLFIPAHIWTPWFSLFGSMSGFDSVDECFGDLADKVYAVETGLSSDPAMNWRVRDIDSRAIISCSDAHSLEKMGREATVFEADDISYDSIFNALIYASDPVSSFPPASARLRLDSKGNQEDNVEPRASKDPSTAATPRIAFTIEFYPEEGKYHYTGHRECSISQSPEETKKNGDKCPVCNRSLTVGVMHRVEDLATKDPELEYLDNNGVRWVKSKNNRPPYVSLVPLAEIIAEVEHTTSIKTKKVFDQYCTLINNLGNEFNVLLKADLNEISRFASPKIVEGIEKVRNRNIEIKPGYDGLFGVVKIWGEIEMQSKEISKEDDQSQLNLFAG